MGHRNKRKRKRHSFEGKEGSREDNPDGAKSTTVIDKVECFSWDPSVARMHDGESTLNQAMSTRDESHNVLSLPLMANVWEAMQNIGRLHIPKGGAPTPIQCHTWTKLLSSSFESPSNGVSTMTTTRLIIQSPTGSGKTLSYGVPLAYRALRQNQSSLVLAPTRELAIQIGTNLKAVVKAMRRIPDFVKASSPTQVATLYGGLDREKQREELRDFEKTGKILVSTTGRLLDLIQSSIKSENNDNEESSEQGTVIVKFLMSVSAWVADEADRMASHSDLSQQVDDILPRIPPNTTTVFASATWPNNTEKWKEWLWRSSSSDSEPCIVVRVNTNAITSSLKNPTKPVDDTTVTRNKSKDTSREVVWSGIPSNITQTLHVCADHKKPRKLLTTLQKLNQGCGRQRPLCIVFFATIKTLQYSTKFLSKEGISCLELHSHMPQHVRERNIQIFSSGKAALLLATDICARGVHVNHVRAVVQYDFPGNMEQYIHRCGVSLNQ